jgi:hypothetical protein
MAETFRLEELVDGKWVTRAAAMRPRALLAEAAQLGDRFRVVTSSTPDLFHPEHGAVDSQDLASGDVKTVARSWLG